MRNVLSTVTIGITAYNEEVNIIHLLNSLLKQSTKSYILEKIIVISDGSTDQTVKLVSNYANGNPLVTFIVNPTRLGKKKRLIQLYKINTSDFIVQLDADVIPASLETIDNLVEGFQNEKIALVGGNIQPVKPETYVEYLFYVWFKIWYEIRRNVEDKNIMHNIHSGVIALRKEFAKNIQFALFDPSDGEYIYCLTRQKKLDFYYVDNAIVFFRLPSNIADYLIQINRSTDERQQLVEFFGEWVYGLFKIPVGTKLRILLKNILKNPFDTLLATALFFILRYIPQTNSQKAQEGVWKIAHSTKSLNRIL